MSSKQITLRLTDSEALVLFEFLTRFSDDGTFAIQDKSEEQVLWNIQSVLESILVAPLAGNYKEQLDKARKELSR